MMGAIRESGGRGVARQAGGSAWVLQCLLCCNITHAIRSSARTKEDKERERTRAKPCGIRRRAIHAGTAANQNREDERASEPISFSTARTARRLNGAQLKATRREPRRRAKSRMATSPPPASPANPTTHCHPSPALERDTLRSLPCDRQLAPLRLARQPLDALVLVRVGFAELVEGLHALRGGDGGGRRRRWRATRRRSRDGGRR